MGLRKTANTRRASRRAVRCAAQSSEEAGEVPGLQEQRCFVVEELRSEGHCLGARIGDGVAALHRAAAGRSAEEGARNSKGRRSRWDGARPRGSQGKQGRQSKVEEGARAHEGELLLLAELRHGQRNGDSRGEVRGRRALSLLQPWVAREEEGARWPWSRGVAGGKRRPAQARAEAWSAQEKPGKRELLGRYPAAERHGQGGSSLRAAVWEKECVLLS
jgi:hypothetical protein